MPPTAPSRSPRTSCFLVTWVLVEKWVHLFLYELVSLLLPASFASSSRGGLPLPSDTRSPLKFSQASQRKQDPGFPHSREREDKSLKFFSFNKAHKSTFALSSLNIPSKCWKLTWIRFYRAHFLTLRKKIQVWEHKRRALVCLWGSHSAFLPPHPFYLQMCARQPAQLQIPWSHVFFKCRSLKGTTANASVALRAFNYVNEVHSKKGMLDFFCLLLSTTPLQFVFFPF